MDNTGRIRNGGARNDPKCCLSSEHIAWDQHNVYELATTELDFIGFMKFLCQGSDSGKLDPGTDVVTCSKIQDSLLWGQKKENKSQTLFPFLPIPKNKKKRTLRVIKLIVFKKIKIN